VTPSHKEMLIGEWRVAHRVALKHEIALAKACLDGSQAVSGIRLAEEQAKVRRMRDIADDLLAMSLAQMEDAANARRRT
jgi:hypothetical protein